MYFVYVLSNWDDSVLYIGVTSNLPRRLYPGSEAQNFGRPFLWADCPLQNRAVKSQISGGAITEAVAINPRCIAYAYIFTSLAMVENRQKIRMYSGLKRIKFAAYLPCIAV